MYKALPIPFHTIPQFINHVFLKRSWPGCYMLLFLFPFSVVLCISFYYLRHRHHYLAYIYVRPSNAGTGLPSQYYRSPLGLVLTQCELGISQTSLYCFSSRCLLHRTAYENFVISDLCTWVLLFNTHTVIISFSAIYSRMEHSVDYAMQCATGRRRQSLQRLQAKQERNICSC